MYVYNVELDKVQSYEFGPLAYPVEHFWDNLEPKLLAVETNKVRTFEVRPVISPLLLS